MMVARLGSLTHVSLVSGKGRSGLERRSFGKGKTVIGAIILGIGDNRMFDPLAR
jgi:hypothetical protein